MTCTARVWASGDMDDCGQKVVVADRCLFHRDNEIKWRQEEVRTLQAKIAEHEARIHELASEEAQDHVALATMRI